MTELHKSRINSEPESDSFQVFKHEEIKCHILHVTVEKGFDISKGWLGNLFDTPDPYLVLWVPGTPNGRRSTRVVRNDRNPEWNEDLAFVVNPERDFELRAMLVDKGTAVDQVLGKAKVDFSDLPLDVEVRQELRFKHGSSVMVKFLKKDDAGRGPHLVFSPRLAQEELAFLEARLAHVLSALGSLLGQQHRPRDLAQVPRVAVVASGGGLRAAVCLAAALDALHRLGVLDCVAYLASLSGSSWYVADLYSRPDFPARSPGKLQQQLLDKLTGGWLKVFCPSRVAAHLCSMSRKKRAGQPVSFTDLFGHLVADLVLGDRKDETLSSQKSKVMSGLAPLPLYTCVHIKKDVSARVYQDWVEFSPLQVGFLKHSLFMGPEQFGARFYLGRAVRLFGEPPLHYLLGVWGSAFSIFLRRVIESSRADALSPPSSAGDPEEAAASASGADQGPFAAGCWTEVDGSAAEDDSGTSSREDEDDDEEDGGPSPAKAGGRGDGARTSRSSRKRLRRILRDKIRRHLGRASRKKPRPSRAERILSWLLRGRLVDTRTGRAGVVFSPMRGVQFSASEPSAPATFTTADDDEDFEGFYEPVCPDTRKLFVADSGLSFNLPYPPLLRPHRRVSLFLSFEFTNRPKDDASPFEELVLAEKWARLHRARFPPVAQLVAQLPPGPPRELYVFQDPADPLCPVVLHFVLVNSAFRRFKDVGVPRETQEERDFADFDIFSDPEKPYSSFKFSFEPLQLRRLQALVDFNVRLHEPLIREQLRRAVLRSGPQPSSPGHGRSPPNGPGHGRSPPSSPGHGQSPPSSPGHGRSPPSSPGHGRSPPSSPGHGRSPPNGPGHGRSPPSSPGHGRSPPSSPGHGRSPPSSPGHGRSSPNGPGHGRGPPSSPGHGQSPPSSPGHGRSSPNGPGHGRGPPSSPGHGQSPPSSTGHV
ncbi:cytosolic phospholipase A2-like isoform X2 [Bacillus rossius redtenbacheri]|uniref:cytosolic phospholipase A2-like isoform X2 n=1 Tax=Bacillus rossius redtenbacheri TaxID=93214 RepID=UPI002FDF0583